MRRLLDGLYTLSGALAAAFLAAICVAVALQVGANIIDKLAGWILGRPFGLLIPSYAEFSGFFLAAASFLGLAYTLKHGSLIRVTLVIRRFDGAPRRVIELCCTGIAALLCGYATWYTGVLVLESRGYNDLSTGLVAVPLWIPQLSLVIGLGVLSVALADEFVRILRGAKPSYAHDEDALMPGELQESLPTRNSEQP